MVGKLEDRLEKLGVNGRIILKMKKYSERKLTRFVWLRTGLLWSTFENNNEIWVP